MRRALAILLLLPALAWGAEPRARLTGPTTALVGQPVLLDVSGSASDEASPLQVKVTGAVTEQPSIRLWYDETRKPGLAVLTAPRPGTYVVVVVAMGVRDGATLPTFDFAVWPLEVTLPAPPIPPGPTPGPVPPAPDPVPPGPAPVTGNLWGVLVLPEYPSAAESALRTSPAIRAAFAHCNATFRSYLATEPELESPGWRKALAGTALPALFWIGDGGRLHGVTKLPTETTIVGDLKALRGK